MTAVRMSCIKLNSWVTMKLKVAAGSIAVAGATVVAVVLLLLLDPLLLVDEPERRASPLMAIAATRAKMKTAQCFCILV